MKKLDKHINTGWMSWEDLEPYKEQLIDMELELMTTYHYPEWSIPRSYPMERVENLKQYISNGNTFFWAATYEQELIGYYWAYTIPFIDKKRWVLRSLMVREDYQNFGIGSVAIKEGIKKAKEMGCQQAVTEYVPDNKGAARVYEKEGYKISRIEVLKSLEEE